MNTLLNNNALLLAIMLVIEVIAVGIFIGWIGFVAFILRAIWQLCKGE